MAAQFPQAIWRHPWRQPWRLPYRTAHGDLPYDLTALTYTSNFFDFSTEDSDCFCALIVDSGTKLYVNGANTDRIYEYALTTAYDVSSAVLQASHDYSGQSGTSTAMWISPDGKHLFLGDDAVGFVRSYTFGTNFDITTLTYDGLALAISQTTDGLTFSDDGLQMWAYEEDDSTWHEYDLATAWVLFPSTVGADKLIQDDGNYGSITSDGRNFIACADTGVANQFNLLIRELKVPNEVSSAQPLTTGQTPQISDGKGAFFVQSALKFYGLSANNIVYEYDVFPG